MSTTLDNYIKLRDGRSLGYAEVGDLQGEPILHFHGTPSSRYEGARPTIGEIATRLGVRLIVPERPGFGLSDFKPKRTIIDWPDDVLELADALNLDRFAVMGLSGGGPYVAACAWKIPHRLTAAGIISGLGPLDAPRALEGMAKSSRQEFAFARKAPWLLDMMGRFLKYTLRTNPKAALALLASEVAEADQAALDNDDLRTNVFKIMEGAFQQGIRGYSWEDRLFVQPWGFRLAEIKLRVMLWHGEKDTLAPIAMGRYMAKAIPNCQAQFYPDEGHLSLFANHYESMLKTMICEVRQSQTLMQAIHER